MDLAVVRRWLHDVVKPYGQPDRIFADVDRTLVALPSLSPKTDVYTYDDGRTQLLLTLTGTVPVNFRSATYNIPIAIWFPRPYPREAPIVYVTPTPDMLVRKGKWVDVSGRVGGEYLQAWDRKPEGCNLLDLIHACQDIFGVEPPVYAKPPQLRDRDLPSRASSSASGSSAQDASSSLRGSHSATPPAQGNGPAPPPLPPQLARSDGAQEGPQARGPPAPPPLPKAFEQQQQHSRQNSLSSPASPQGAHHRYAQDPRYVLKEPCSPPSHSPIQHPPQHFQQHSFSTTTTHPASLQNTQSSSSWASPTRTQTQTTNVQYASPRDSPVVHNQVPPPLPPQPPPTTPVTDWMSSDDADTVSPSASGPSSTAPPPLRPPNPELLHLHALLHTRLTERVTQLRTSLTSSNAQLRALQADLQRGPAAIEDESARLRAVRDVCSATRARMEEAVGKAKEEVERVRSEGADVDEEGLVCATSIVGNQLLDLVAEDNAIEDTLYHLGRALNAERIDLGTFLKQTRFLAREQFMRRALTHKITEGMGW